MFFFMPLVFLFQITLIFPNIPYKCSFFKFSVLFYKIDTILLILRPYVLFSIIVYSNITCFYIKYTHSIYLLNMCYVVLFVFFLCSFYVLFVFFSCYIKSIFIILVVYYVKISAVYLKLFEMLYFKRT